MQGTRQSRFQIEHPHDNHRLKDEEKKKSLILMYLCGVILGFGFVFRIKGELQTTNFFVFPGVTDYYFICEKKFFLKLLVSPE